MVTRHEPTCISVARCACISFCSFLLSLSPFLAFLAPICWRSCKRPNSRLPTHQQPAHAPTSPVARLADGYHAPGCQKNVPATSLGRWVLVNCSMVQYEQTGGTEVGRQGCRREKCREALVSRLILLPLCAVAPGSRWTCPGWCARKCSSKSFMIKFILKSMVAINSMARPARSL